MEKHRLIHFRLYKSIHLNLCVTEDLAMLLTLWRPLAFGDFRKKKRLNARGFAREFLQSGMLYRPGKSLKRCGKSSSLHSKRIFCLGVRVFCE